MHAGKQPVLHASLTERSPILPFFRKHKADGRSQYTDKWCAELEHGAGRGLGSAEVSADGGGSSFCRSSAGFCVLEVYLVRQPCTAAQEHGTKPFPLQLLTEIASTELCHTPSVCATPGPAESMRCMQRRHTG